MKSIHLPSGGSTNKTLTANKILKCEQCDKEIKKQSNLKRHVITIHNIASHVNCPTCGKEFKRKDNMLRHNDNCILNILK